MYGPPSSRGVAIRDRGEALQWLAAGLWLSRIVSPTQAEVRRVTPWILAALGERLDLPPLGVVVDIGALLHGETMGRPSAMGHARLDGAIRRYEDTLLGRLGADPRMSSCADALAKLPEDLRAEGVGIFVASLMDRIAFEQGRTIQPGVARAATAKGTSELVAGGAAALHESESTRGTFADAYEALARGAQRASALVTDADVFTLENLAVLRTLTQRLAIQQIVLAREAIGASLRTTIKSKRRNTGDRATRDEAESEYPVGGFASVATYGSIENIVTSELIYMDQSQGRDRPLDLFDVRYAEGELLYYTRDEAILLRHRRCVTFLFAGDLVDARLKDPSLDWQRIVALVGMVAAVVEKLDRELGAEALVFRVVFVLGEDRPSPLKAERELCTLLFREWHDKGMLNVVESTLKAEAVVLAAETKRSLVETVFCACDDGAQDRWSQMLRGVPGGARVVSVPLGVALSSAADLATWQTAATELVAHLL
jgi:hypothetical protein